jgi:hypothetical protein
MLRLTLTPTPVGAEGGDDLGLSVVVPVYRSATCLGPLVDAIRAALHPTGLAYEAANFSVRPLRLVTWCGLLLGLLGGLLAMVVVFYRLLYPQDFEAAVAGWASLMVTQLVIGGARMIFLGILGEYVGRMHTAVAGKKPQATVREVLNVNTRAVSSRGPTAVIPAAVSCGG